MDTISSSSHAALNRGPQHSNLWGARDYRFEVWALHLGPCPLLPCFEIVGGVCSAGPILGWYMMGIEGFQLIGKRISRGLYGILI